jgi:hypothetical protein
MQNTRIERNLVIGIEEQGLLMQISAADRLVAWSDVAGITAGRAPLNADVWIFVLAIEIALDLEHRILIVGEVEPPWLALVTLLPTFLSDCEPFETWAPKVLAAINPVTLYERESAAEPA